MRKTLEEMVGPEEAGRIREVLRDAAELTRQTVLARIDRRATEFNNRYAPGSSERKEVERRASVRPWPSSYLDEADAFEDFNCPSCATKGWLFGSVSEEDVVDSYEDADTDFGPYHVEIVRTVYAVEGFRCPECTLRLEGRDEVAIAGLPSDFTRDDEREPDYEPDYGND